MCGDARCRDGGVTLPILDLAPYERREEFGVEACVLISQAIVGCRGRIVTEELLGEARLPQCLMHVARERHIRREGEVCVSGTQGQVTRWLGQPMKAVEPVSPPAHDDELAKPRPERRHEPSEGLEILHSAASFDEAMEDTLPDQVRLFSPARRVRDHVDPDLQHVARGHALLPHHSSEYRLRRGGLPHDDVR